jgi:hypothetical protein
MDRTAGDGELVALVEPARAQVIALAADVAGRLAPNELPASLRPIARFAPAKRARLGGVVLAAALDGDDEFRSHVAQALAEAAPELTASVRAGEPTPAADPVDVAVVAYLTRPAGWTEVLIAANRRWSAERVAERAAPSVEDDLRAELQEIRIRAKGEPGRVKQAVADATGALDAELATIRRQLRDRTRDLRAAERERDAATEAAAQARAELVARTESHAAQLRAIRAEQEQTRRSAETARRGSRIDRELDEARLWLLVDTVVQAANGVRRELSLPPQTVRPADGVAATLAADTAPPGGGPEGRRTATDPAGLDRLLALPHVHLVVDGYNVTKTGYGDLPLADQRTRLVGGLAALAARSRAEVTVVFDGGVRPPAQPVTPRGVRVLFSAPGQLADDLIRELVAAEPTGRPVVVVTSDAEVARDTARDGAWGVPSPVLLARLG